MARCTYLFSRGGVCHVYFGVEGRIKEVIWSPGNGIVIDKPESNCMQLKALAMVTTIPSKFCSDALVDPC